MTETGEKEPFDILEAAFSMGYMAGVPNISAMQAIEDYCSGIYFGAVGYITSSDDFDLM